MGLFLGSTLYSVLLVYVSVFVPVQYCFGYCSFVVQFEIKECDIFSSVLLRVTLAILSLLCFCTKFRIICSSYVKNAVGIFIGIVLNLQIALDSIKLSICARHFHNRQENLQNSE